MTIDERIYNTAIGDGMPAPLAAIMVAQSRHETGNYTSKFFTNGKNGFGYSFYPGSKWQLSIPGPVADNGQSIAQYSSLENSVHEITSWVKRRQAEGNFPSDLRTITTPDYYAILLKQNNYFGDTLSNYTQALISWLRNMGEFSLKSEGAAVILILALGLIIFRKKIFK